MASASEALYRNGIINSAHDLCTRSKQGYALTSDDYRVLATAGVIHKEEAGNARDRRIAHETAYKALGDLHSDLQAQHSGLKAQQSTLETQHQQNQQAIAEKSAKKAEQELVAAQAAQAETQAAQQQQAAAQEKRTNAEKLVKMFVGRIFLANLTDKSAGQKNALIATTNFLREINNDALKGPISIDKDSRVELYADAISHLSSILSNNSGWTSLDISGARGTIDVQSLNALLGHYPNLVNVILGKGHQATKSTLESISARRLNITISEK